jgi:hypothetical protein
VRARRGEVPEREGNRAEFAEAVGQEPAIAGRQRRRVGLPGGLPCYLVLPLRQRGVGQHVPGEREIRLITLRGDASARGLTKSGSVTIIALDEGEHRQPQLRIGPQPWRRGHERAGAGHALLQGLAGLRQAADADVQPREEGVQGRPGLLVLARAVVATFQWLAGELRLAS